MGLVGPRVLNYLGESKAKAAKIQIESFSQRARSVLSRHRPLSDHARKAWPRWSARPATSPSWNGPYLKGGGVPDDPWGKPYVYRSPGRARRLRHHVLRLGRTGRRHRHGRRHHQLARAERSASERRLHAASRSCACSRSSRCSPPSCCRRCRAAPRARGWKPMRCETAALLKADRNAAIRSRAAGRDRDRRAGAHRCAPARPAASSAAGRRALRCDCSPRAAISARPAPTIDFFASGMSCGGVIALTPARHRLRNPRQLAHRRRRDCPAQHALKRPRRAPASP